MIDIERLRELLRYDAETGIFTWKIAPSSFVKAGDVAGAQNAQGYTVIGIGDERYRANRLAWYYVNGAVPPDMVDHINGVRNDDRLVNLRLATRSQNLMNQAKGRIKTSIWKGVSWDKHKSRWVAQIGLDHKRVKLGRFVDEREAAEAYMFAALEHFGEFARLA